MSLEEKLLGLRNRLYDDGLVMDAKIVQQALDVLRAAKAAVSP